MRYIIAIVMFWVTVSANAFSVDRISSLKALPPFERTVLIIKYFETLHRPCHWPTIGYGHVVQPGEHYHRGVQLSEKQADALLRKDLNYFLSLFDEYGDDKYLLAALAYNCGPGNVQKSSVLKRLKNGDRDILKPYLAHCRYKGKQHKGIKRRRLIEYTLLFDKSID